MGAWPLTALRAPEYEAVMRNGWTWEAAKPVDNVLFVQRAEFQSGGRTCVAHAAVAPRMGMVSTALTAAKLIEHAAAVNAVNGPKELTHRDGVGDRRMMADAVRD